MKQGLFLEIQNVQEGKLKIFQFLTQGLDTSLRSVSVPYWPLSTVLALSSERSLVIPYRLNYWPAMVDTERTGTLAACIDWYDHTSKIIK